jgi:hypothetical protein
MGPARFHCATLLLTNKWNFLVFKFILKHVTKIDVPAEQFPFNISLTFFPDKARVGKVWI